MKHIRAIVIVGLLLGTIALSGCESKQHKLTRLQAEYDAVNKQYYADCVAPAIGGGGGGYFSGKKPTLPTPAQQKAQQQKCAVERAKADKLLNQIMAAQTK